MKLGIVGLPNVGKSTLFNAITSAGAEAANYPFCTIEPNVGMVTVPDARLDWLREVHHRRSGQRRVQGGRSGQQIPLQYPLHRRHRPRGPLL